jgi:PQQ-like domain
MIGGKHRPRTSRPRARSVFKLVPEYSLEPRLMPSVDVLTYHNNNARTGANLNETVLTPANVNPATFGKLGQVSVDGQIYGQPLVKTGVHLPDGSVHDVVYVATENDSIYAFDADTLAPLWHDVFINPALGITAVSTALLQNDPDVKPSIGITSTPVIDPTTNTLYAVSEVQSATTKGLTYTQQLHAVDLATGAEKFGAPVTIKATVAGTGVGSSHGKLTFQPEWQFQRPGLLLANGTVYVAFSSHNSQGPYHGWLLGYNARTLKQTAAFSSTPAGYAGGIWMGGDGPAADAAGNIYLSVGNGTFKPRSSGGDYGDSVVKLAPTRTKGLKVVDYYAPPNQAMLAHDDLDLGSGGVLLLPDQPGATRHLLIAGGKVGTVFLLNRDNLGHFSADPTKDKAVEQLPGALGHIFSSPAYFNGTIYYGGFGTPRNPSPSFGDRLKAFAVVNGIVQPTATSVTPFTFSYPGPTPSVSANGAANGIVWTISSTGGVADLSAFDASNLSQLLYDSTATGPSAQGPGFVKFTVPTVASGKVYVGGDGGLALYGLFGT